MLYLVTSKGDDLYVLKSDFCIQCAKLNFSILSASKVYVRMWKLLKRDSTVKSN